VAGLVAAGALEGRLQLAQLVRAADEGAGRRGEPDRVIRQLQEPVSADRGRAALEGERLERLGEDRVLDERVDVLADQDLAR
jgi:hypothetical protein